MERDEDFIPHEQALILKELGFDEPCLNRFYTKSKSKMFGVDEKGRHFPIKNTSKKLYTLGEHYVLKDNNAIIAPLYQQAFRWFRKKYNLHCEIQPIFKSELILNYYRIRINDTTKFELGRLVTYEEAELACLKKLIEIVKKTEIMVNIHLLAAELPSDLLLCIKDYTEHKDTPAENSDNKGNLRLGYGKYANTEFYQPQYIYIISNDDIKEKDWYLMYWSKDNLLANPIKAIKDIKPQSSCIKIIMTNNPKLIADGIQAIPDEFLEWFIKNPSCEVVKVDEKSVVEIEKELNIFGHDQGLNESEYNQWLKDGGELYKIIIPKEDLGYTTKSGVKVSDEMVRAVMIPKEYFGKEIVESVSIGEETVDIITYEPSFEETFEEIKKPIGDFIIANAAATQGSDGAYYHYSEVCKLLRLQQEKSYSEEEIQFNVNNLLNTLFKGKMHSNMIAGIVNEWFEKFKK